MGGRDLGVPRLRLPAAALAGPAEVPGRRTGAWRSSARSSRTKYLDRTLVDCPSPPVPTEQRRPHRRARAEGRPLLRRRRADRRPDLRHRADAGSPTSSRSTAPPAPGSRPTRSSSCSASRRTGSTSLVDALDGIGLSARPSNWRRSTMACTGIEFCKLAIVETKQRAADLIGELEQRFPDLDTPITRQRQRLPERLRPHPGRRHRPQGPAGPRRRRHTRSRASRCTSAAGSGSTRSSAGSCGRTRSPAPASTTTSPTSSPRSSTSAPTGETFAQWVGRADDDALRGEVGHRELEVVR